MYDMYANNPKYKDMMQLYLGKPLLVVYASITPVAERNPGGTTTVSRYAG